MTTLRTVNNTGSPIVDVAGNVLSNATVLFELVDANGNATDTFDTTTFERIYGSTTTLTDTGGILQVALWPNDRGTTLTMYKCSVPNNTVGPFMGFVASGAGVLTWYAFRAQTITYTPPQATALDAHINNLSNPHQTTKAQVGLSNADNTSDVNKPVSTAQAAADAVVASNAASALSTEAGTRATNDTAEYNRATAAEALLTPRTSTTGSTTLPASTTANRDGSPAVGYLRYNTSLNQFEGYGAAGWGKVGGGTSGAGTDAGMYENDAFISSSYTIGSGSLISGVTVTIATPGVFSLTGHGFVQDSQVMLETTGALPTGLLVDTGYFVIAAGLTANAFELSATQGGAAINTSGSQSGVHSVGKLKNASSAGVVSIATGAAITVPTNSTWSIL